MKIGKKAQNELIKWLNMMENDYKYFREQAYERNSIEIATKRENDLENIYLIEYCLKKYFNEMNKEVK